MTELTWDAPGPGSWQWDAAHGSKPASPIVQELFPPSMAEGFQAFTAEYGLPLSHIEVRYVNGYPYSAPQMADLTARAVPPPVAAEHAIESRRWREELRSWNDDLRPALVAARRALQAIDVDALSDEALAEHLEQCAAEFRRGMTTHFSLAGATAIPVGDFLAHCRDWGIALDAALDVLTGEHPLTVACRPVRAAIGDARPRSLDELRALSPSAARALEDLIDTASCWAIGRYDVTGRTLGEEPSALLGAILAQPPAHASDDTLREQVPTDERALFDELLAEARGAFSARDDHATIGGLWSIGLIRRALLAAAPRLKLDEPHHVFLLSVGEIAGALRHGEAPVELAQERAVAAAVAEAATPPPTLGDGGFGGPPPGIVMPGALGRVLTAMFTYLEVMNGNARAMGIGGGTVRGRAVVALDPEDAMDRIEPGDILVTTTTTPAFGAVLPMLGGIVAASGGPLSHTAIVARELGMPAIVGMSDALVRIADGVQIELDAAAVEVRVV